jgi:two-component system response regulator FixJ
MRKNPLVRIVEDDADLRAAITRLVVAAGWDAEAYADGRALLEGGDPRRPGCVLLDVGLPGWDGLRVQQELRAAGWTAPIVFLTGFADVGTAVRAMREGALDFVEKPFRPSELMALLARAIEHDAASRNARDAREAASERLARLSPRERQVVDGIIEGHSTKEVAARLGISPRTAEIHRQRAMRRMEVESLAELVRTVLTATALRESPPSAPEP